MKHYFSTFLFIMIVLPNVLLANNFDFSLIGGIKIGMSKNQVLALLKEQNIEYEERKNDVGGKYIKAIPDITIFGFKILEIRIGFEHNKVFVVFIESSNIDFFKIKEKIDKISDCRYHMDDSECTCYFFSNCVIFSEDSDEELSFKIMKRGKFKCKD